MKRQWGDNIQITRKEFHDIFKLYDAIRIMQQTTEEIDEDSRNGQLAHKLFDIILEHQDGTKNSS